MNTKRNPEFYDDKEANFANEISVATALGILGEGQPSRINSIAEGNGVIKLTPKPEWTKKAWGQTREVCHGPNFEVHELQVKAGGYCSRHRHRKWNLFHVTSGQLKVELFGVDDLGECLPTPYDDRILNDGDQFRVSPEEFHRFAALTDCTLLEVYWTVNIDHDDIDRADEGGMNAQ